MPYKWTCWYAGCVKVIFQMKRWKWNKFSHHKFKRLEVKAVANWKSYRKSGELSMSGYLILWHIHEFFCPVTVLSKPIQLNYNFPCRIQTWFILDSSPWYKETTICFRQVFKFGIWGRYIFSVDILNYWKKAEILISYKNRKLKYHMFLSTALLSLVSVIEKLFLSHGQRLNKSNSQ